MAQVRNPNLFKLKNLGFQNIISGKPEVVVVNGEPLVKIYPLGEDPELISYERLRLLNSGVLTSYYRANKDLSIIEEIFLERARLGQKTILQVWNEHGCAVVYKNIKKLVFSTLSPTPVGKSQTRVINGTKVVMKFLTPFAGPAYWALVVRDSEHEIGKAAWNDYAGLKELAVACLDTESASVMFALINPDAASVFVANKKQKAEQTTRESIAHRYFEDAVFSLAHKKSIHDLIESYNHGLSLAVLRAKQDIVLTESPISLKAGTPLKAEIGLYPKRAKDPIELQFSLGYGNSYSQYSLQSNSFTQALKVAEGEAWKQLNQSIKDLGFVVSPMKVALEANANYQVLAVHRSFTIMRDLAKHDEALKHNSTEESLHFYVATRLGV